MNVLLLNDTTRGLARLILRQLIYKEETRTLNSLLQDLSLEGKTTLATGGTKVIGKATTDRLGSLACLPLQQRHT